MKNAASIGKRAIDLFFCLLGLLMLSPLLLVIAAFVKLDTRGPVFYRQERSGQGGQPFWIFKFRTMVVGAYRSGARLTVKRDPRVTRVGHVLRWTKLDELPQLFNVFVGDMSLVGPRPEDPYFVNFYSTEQRGVLDVKPGMIGPSQMDGRDETDEYPDSTVDTESYYIEHLLPGKLARDLDYVRNFSVAGDLGFLLVGVFKLALSQLKVGFFARNRSRIYMALGDLLLVILAYIFANLLKMDWVLEDRSMPYIGVTLLWITVLRPPVFVYFGLYQRAVERFSRRDFAAIIKAVSVGSALIVAADYFSGFRGHSRAIFLIDWMLVVFMLTISRYLMQAFRAGGATDGWTGPMVNVLVAGSGHGADNILRALLEDPESRYMPMGIIDHEPDSWGGLIHGVRVIGGASDMAMAASTHQVKLVLVSLADLSPTEVRDITEACKAIGIPYRLLPALSGLLEQMDTGILDAITAVREREA